MHKTPLPSAVSLPGDKARGITTESYNTMKFINILSPDEAQLKQELRKSRVRVNVTYAATVFIFGGALLLMVWGARGSERFDQALDVYNVILPIAAGIVTYWFATRSNRPNSDKSNNAKPTTTGETRIEDQVS